MIRAISQSRQNNKRMDSSLLTVWAILAWIGVGGALGGLLDFLNRLKFKDNCIVLGGEKVHGWTTLLCLSAIDALIGMGGAGGVQALMISIGKFSVDSSVQNQVSLLTLSIIAGFGGRRLLPKLTDRLERQLDEVKAETGEAKRESQVALGTAIEATTMAKVLSALRNDASPIERYEAIRELTRDSLKEPKNRKYAILLGRLNKANHDYETAIERLYFSQGQGRS